MLSGEKLTFVEEARGLFGAAPDFKPLASYDPILAKIDALVPGTGALADRVQAYEDRFNIPADRLRPVMDAAIAECRARTLRHFALPANERFDLSFVTGKSWSGYNYYQGDAKSRIEINTDLPMRISRAVDLGCHEGYPGHHVYNALLEQNLTRDRGWIEFSVYPLYSPQSLIAEGSANYGIELAFPGEEQAAFEAAVLYPLAGLDPRETGRFFALQKAKKGLKLAGLTIAADYLDGKIDRETAIRLSQKYELNSRERADQGHGFCRPVPDLRHQLRLRPRSGPRLHRGRGTGTGSALGPDARNPERANDAGRFARALSSHCHFSWGRGKKHDTAFVLI